MVTGSGTLTYGDGTRAVVVTAPIDFMNWDRWRARHKQSVNPVDAPFTFELFIVYASLQRTGAVPESTSFDVWADTVAELDLDIGSPNPTNPEASDA